MPKVKWSKLPWSEIASMILAWWQGRKKNDKDKGDSQVPTADNKPAVDTQPTGPIK